MTARGVFEQEVFIEAAPDVVVAHLASFEHHDVIHPMIVDVRELKPVTTPEGATRRRYSITDRMRLGPIILRFTYLATIQVSGDGDMVSDAFQFPRVHLCNVTSCRPEGAGTRVQERVIVEAPSLLLRFVVRQAQRAHHEMLANLKHLLETRTASLPSV